LATIEAEFAIGSASGEERRRAEAALQLLKMPRWDR
jgi:hypothetical protein